MITRFLADWTRRPAYLEALARGDVRRDLDGCPAGAPDDAARTFAAVPAWPAGRGRAMSSASKSLIRHGNSVVRLVRRRPKADPWNVYDALPAPIRAALQEGPEELDPLWAP